MEFRRVRFRSSDDTYLAEAQPKIPEQALELANEYFQEWFPGAEGMLETARFSHAQGRLKDAAFLTHQATERLYHCVLLVCTFYTPHVHNLGFLRTQAERIDARLIDVWPRRSEEHTSELQSLMRISYAVFCLKKKKHKNY